MNRDSQTIVNAAREAGIIGAGGAGFPTHIKLQANVETFIANGAECEPLLNNDKAVMLNRTSELFEGVELAAKATGARRKIIAIKAKAKEVIAHLESRMGLRGAEIFPLKDYYPAGDEQEIVHEVIGKTIPEAGIPLDVGALVQNVETLVNLARAMDGKPVIRRVLTVIGEVERPGVVEVPIGASIQDVIKACGGVTCTDPVAYTGGPMMGELAVDLNQPIMKTTSGIFILPADNFLIQKRSISMDHILKQAQSACTNCMQCTESCPRNLLGHKIRPHKIMNAVTLGLSYQSDVFLESFLCMFCGVCEFACPMWLSPKRVYAEIRAGLAAQNIRYPRVEKEYKDHPIRIYRRVSSGRLIRRYQLSKYDRKLPLSIQPIEIAKVRISTRQGLGLPALPVVSEGDWVKEGQLIGEIPEGKLGARIHASIEGRVTYSGPDAVEIER